MKSILQIIIRVFNKLTSICKWGFIWLSIPKLYVLGGVASPTSVLLILTIVFSVLAILLQLFTVILANTD